MNVDYSILAKTTTYSTVWSYAQHVLYYFIIIVIISYLAGAFIKQNITLYKLQS